MTTKHNASDYYKSLLDFSSFFNNPSFCDLVVHTSNDPSAAKIFCHKFVIKAVGPNLYEALMQNKIESEADVDHVLIVPELQNKDEAAKLFFNIIYDDSIVEKTIEAQLVELNETFKIYSMWDLSRAVQTKSRLAKSPFGEAIRNLTPKLNCANDLSDFTIYLDQEKKSFLKTHRIILQKASMYYSGFFNSGMKESNSRESIITLDADIKHEELCQLMQKLMEFAYSESPITQDTFENMMPDVLFGVSMLATKYLFNGIQQQFAAFIESTKEYPEYILPAIKYNDANAMVIATEALLRNITEIKFEMIPVDFLQNVRVGEGGNIFHAILSHKMQGTLSPLHQVQTLLKMFGENSPITLKTKDDEGNNCLHFICKNSPNLFSEVVDLMITQKMDLNDQNNEGDTALNLALKSLYGNDTASPAFHIGKLSNTVTQAPLTVVDKLIGAGAKVDLEKDQHLQLFLAHVGRFENGRSYTVWKIIEGLLDTVSKERVTKCIARRDVMTCLANAFTRPIEYLFRKLKIEISIEVKQSSKTKKEKLIQVKSIDLEKIEIRENIYELAKMKVTRKTEITNPHHNWEAFEGFDVDVGIHNMYFEPNEDAHTLIAGLVYHVAGAKQVQETKTNKSPLKFWK